VPFIYFCAPAFLPFIAGHWPRVSGPPQDSRTLALRPPPLTPALDFLVSIKEPCSVTRLIPTFLLLASPRRVFSSSLENYATPRSEDRLLPTVSLPGTRFRSFIVRLSPLRSVGRLRDSTRLTLPAHRSSLHYSRFLFFRHPPSCCSATVTAFLRCRGSPFPLCPSWLPGKAMGVALQSTCRRCC